MKWLALTGTCGLFLFASLAFIVLLKIEVNGPVYQGIRLSNDLVADYVAPSESLLETALTCAKLADAPDEASRHAYEEDLKTFRHDYDSTHAKYMARVPEGPLKALMRGEAHATAQEYFKLEDQLIALRSRDWPA